MDAVCWPWSCNGYFEFLYGKRIQKNSEWLNGCIFIMFKQMIRNIYPCSICNSWTIRNCTCSVIFSNQQNDWNELYVVKMQWLAPHLRKANINITATSEMQRTWLHLYSSNAIFKWVRYTAGDVSSAWLESSCYLLLKHQRSHGPIRKQCTAVTGAYTTTMFSLIARGFGNC